MKSFLTSLFLILSISCNAQVVELGYSPGSVKGWGNLPKTTKFSATLLFPGYYSQAVDYVPGIRYTHLHSKNQNLRDRFGETVNGTFNMFFFMPASFNFSVGKIILLDRIGLGLSDKTFPNNDGEKLNFLFEGGLSLPLTNFFSFSFRYSHISNGFQGQINPGLDNVVLTMGLHF